MTPTTNTGLIVAAVPRERFRECERLARDVFGFTDLEATPAWHMYTTTLFGGVGLAASLDDEIVGYIYAFPAVTEGKPFLYATELSVRPELRSQGIGMRLMSAMRDAGNDLGYRLIKWTTNAVSSRNLYIYLTRCRARIVGLRSMMYVGLFDNHGEQGLHGDEVEIDWHISDASVEAAVADPPRSSGSCERIAPALLTTTEPAADSFRRVVDWRDNIDQDCLRYWVEIPWDAEALEAHSIEAINEWRRAVRRTMRALLERGYEGVDVALDRSERRSFVAFELLRRRCS
jgi:predicted GNAT superfamily acetyltransferase